MTGLKAVLIDPGKDPDTAIAPTSTSGVAGVAQVASVVPSAAAPGPAIITRAQWGADESLRTCEPDLSTSTVAAAIHHTASTNSYSAADVPGLIRGFYAYHTRSVAAGGRGWCDIGYNFLVDKFGRIFEGRAGSIDKAVVGAHTGGYNSRSFGVSAIGEYGSAAPPGVMIEAISQVVAWKFKTYRILAGVDVTIVAGSGEGAPRFAPGTLVTLPTIFAHRDVSLTACPGQGLYDQLGYIRARVSELSNASVAASPIWSLDSLTANASSISVKGWALDPETTASLDVIVAIDGAAHTMSASQDVPGLATAFPQNGTAHGFSATFPAASGQHEVCLTVLNVGAGTDVQIGCRWEDVHNAAPIGALDLVQTSPTTVRIAGWALDPDETNPIQIHVYLGDALYAVVAGGSRPDVGSIYGMGDNHGFDATFTVTPGEHQLCVYAINTPPGINQLIACRVVRAGNAPVGVIDSATATADAITITGWAFDPDTTDSIGVHFYVDGRWAGVTTASSPRADVGAVYGHGDNHGYTTTLPATSGTHHVCAYAIDTNGGTNPEIACRTVTP